MCFDPPGTRCNPPARDITARDNSDPVNQVEVPERASVGGSYVYRSFCIHMFYAVEPFKTFKSLDAAGKKSPASHGQHKDEVVHRE